MSTDDDLLLPLDEGPGPALRTSERSRRALVDHALAARNDDLAMPLDELGPALPLSNAAVEQMVARARMRFRPSLQSLSSRPAPTPLTMSHDEDAPAPRSLGRRAPRAPRWGMFAAAAAIALACGFSLRGFVDRTRADAPVPAAQPITSAPPAPVVSPVAERKKLLADADALRRDEQWVSADLAYAKVSERFPGSVEAEQATLARAYLHLEPLLDPQKALAFYDEVVRGGGPAAVEAELGRTFALRALGRRRAEIEALRSLVVHHPTSPLRFQAEQRLHELEPR